MGGILSGSRSGRGGRATTDRAPSIKLTVARLCRLEGWRDDVRISMESPDLFILVCGGVEYPAVIDSTPCQYGGFRRWFLCGKCGRRCTVLHIVGREIACRVCHKLAYASQGDNARGRLFRRVDAIRHRLGWTPGVISPKGCKPHRMHWRTYMGLRTELAELTEALFQNLGDWVDKAEMLHR